MDFNQSVEETMSDLICHVLKRTDHLNTGDQLAIRKEYREWIKCIKNKKLVPQNLLFINTSTFGKYLQQDESLSLYLEKFLNFLRPYIYTQIL